MKRQITPNAPITPKISRKLLWELGSWELGVY